MRWVPLQATRLPPRASPTLRVSWTRAFPTRRPTRAAGACGDPSRTIPSLPSPRDPLSWKSPSPQTPPPPSSSFPTKPGLPSTPTCRSKGCEVPVKIRGSERDGYLRPSSRAGVQYTYHSVCVCVCLTRLASLSLSLETLSPPPLTAPFRDTFPHIPLGLHAGRLLILRTPQSIVAHEGRTRPWANNGLRTRGSRSCRGGLN